MVNDLKLINFVLSYWEVKLYITYRALISKDTFKTFSKTGKADEVSRSVRYSVSNAALEYFWAD